MYGSYVHGVFDDPGIARSLTEALLAKKGLCADLDGTVDFDYGAFKEMQFAALAKGLPGESGHGSDLRDHGNKGRKRP